MPNRYACLCCGYRTLDEAPPGTYIICPVCGWEDDYVQGDDLDDDGGANHVSLRQARENFRKYGVSDLEKKERVRPPLPEEG